MIRLTELDIYPPRLPNKIKGYYNKGKNKMSDLEKNNNWYLIEQKSKVEDRILKRICFVNAERDTCEEIVLKVHDGYSLSITPDFEVDEDGRVHVWLETVGEKVEEV
jgi:hypothetical protein